MTAEREVKPQAKLQVAEELSSADSDFLAALGRRVRELRASWRPAKGTYRCCCCAGWPLR